MKGKSVPVAVSRSDCYWFFSCRVLRNVFYCWSPVGF